MAKEAVLRQRVGGWMKDAGFFHQAIESGICPGMPDIWYIRQGITGWLELKMLKQIPARAHTPLFASLNHPLSNEQINWIGRCLRQGGRAHIFVGYMSHYFLIHGDDAELFNDLTWESIQRYKITKEGLINRLQQRII